MLVLNTLIQGRHEFFKQPKKTTETQEPENPVLNPDPNPEDVDPGTK